MKNKSMPHFQRSSQNFSRSLPKSRGTLPIGGWNFTKNSPQTLGFIGYELYQKFPRTLPNSIFLKSAETFVSHRFEACQKFTKFTPIYKYIGSPFKGGSPNLYFLSAGGSHE